VRAGAMMASSVGRGSGAGGEGAGIGAVRCGRPWRRPEVGGGADRWAPSVGERERGEGGWAGRR
jgi:hypothetical protein